MYLLYGPFSIVLESKFNSSENVIWAHKKIQHSDYTRYKEKFVEVRHQGTEVELNVFSVIFFIEMGQLLVKWTQYWFHIATSFMHNVDI